MKLSVFTVRDIGFSYGVVEFEQGEDPLSILASRDPEGLRGELEGALGAPIASLSIARGSMWYKGSSMPLVYLRLELEDGSDYSIELYPGSARSFSNTEAEEHFNTVVKLFSAVSPGLRLPRGRLVGFA